MQKKFYDLKNLMLALNFAKDSAKKSFIPDIFRHQDFVHNSNKLLHNISLRLKNKEYKAHQILTIDIPKSGLTTRPGSILEFSDLVVLFSIISSFIEKLKAEYGNILIASEDIANSIRDLRNKQLFII